MAFQKGQSGNPTGKRKGPRPEELLPPGAEDELEVMRHVKRDQRDLTYQHWESRQWKAKNEEEWQKAWLLLERRAERTRIGSTATSTATSPAGSVPETAPTMSSTLPPETPERIIEQLGESWVQAQEYLANRPEFLAWKAKR